MDLADSADRCRVDSARAAVDWTAIGAVRAKLVSGGADRIP